MKKYLPKKSMIIYQNLLKLFLFMLICENIHFMREQFWGATMFGNAFFEGANLTCTNFLKCIFFEGAVLKCTSVLKCIFWETNSKVHSCSEIHFLREQFWSARMFWNAFFEKAILKCTNVLKCIFRESNCFNFLIHGCWLPWLLLMFFVKVFTTSKNCPVLACININLRVIANWLQSS